MRNIKIVIALTLTFIVSTIIAQEESSLKIKEYGIGLNNLNSFSLQYRWGNEKRLYRINAVLGGYSALCKSSNSTINQDPLNPSSSSNATDTKTPLNLNCGLNFSILKLKAVNEKFGAMYGNVIGLSYFYNNREDNQKITNTNGNPNPSGNIITKTTSQSLNPFVGVVLGVYYKINPSFLVYAEIAPNIYYSYTQTKTNSTNSQQYSYTNNGSSSLNTFGISNLSNSGAALTFVYRITK